MSAAQSFKTQLRQQNVELYSRSQECEQSKQEQYLLGAVLQSRERAHQGALSNMRDEVEEFRKTRRSEAELREQAHQDAISPEGESGLDNEVRESQSTVN